MGADVFSLRICLDTVFADNRCRWTYLNFFYVFSLRFIDSFEPVATWDFHTLIMFWELRVGTVVHVADLFSSIFGGSYDNRPLIIAVFFTSVPFYLIKVIQLIKKLIMVLCSQNTSNNFLPRKAHFSISIASLEQFGILNSRWGAFQSFCGIFRPCHSAIIIWSETSIHKEAFNFVALYQFFGLAIIIGHNLV
jgi:hypothetical protein